MSSRKIMKLRRIDFTSDFADHECAFLAMLGFSDRLIMGSTKLTRGQVQIRLRKAHIKRRDYRDGKSPLARQVVQRVQDVTEKQLEDHLNKYLLK